MPGTVTTDASVRRESRLPAPEEAPVDRLVPPGKPPKSGPTSFLWQFQKIPTRRAEGGTHGRKWPCPDTEEEATEPTGTQVEPVGQAGQPRSHVATGTRSPRAFRGQGRGLTPLPSSCSSSLTLTPHWSWSPRRALARHARVGWSTLSPTR